MPEETDFQYTLALWELDGTLLAPGYDSLAPMFLSDPGDYFLWLSAGYRPDGAVFWDFTEANLNYSFQIQLSQASVPEPGTLALFAIGLAGVGIARRRKAV